MLAKNIKMLGLAAKLVCNELLSSASMFQSATGIIRGFFIMFVSSLK